MPVALCVQDKTHRPGCRDKHSRSAFSDGKGDKMKKYFDRLLCLFLAQALVLTLLPAAWAEEWDTGLLEFEETVDESPDFYVLEEETLGSSGTDEEYFLEASPGDDGGFFPAGPNGTGTETDAEVASSNSAAISFAAAELDADVYFCARLNEIGNLDFFLLLPDNVGEAEYRIVAEDGQGSGAAYWNAAGESIIPVFVNVRPEQIRYNMYLTLRHGGTERSTSVWEYLKQMPRYCGGTEAAMQMPRNVARCSGSISGVTAWHAGIDTEYDDTAIRLYFRAEDTRGLHISCDGHAVSEPVRENADLWSVRVTGISVAELPADFIISAEKAGETVLLSFSPFCYAAAHWGEGTPFILLCKALAAVMAA